MNAVADKMLFDSAASVQASVGRQLGETEWVQITQERINQFADATGDQQWIHTDPERAAQGPFGAPIAHGFLTLSDTAEFLYKTTDTWSPEHERAIIWNDPMLNIDWPLSGLVPQLAAKDAAAVAFNAAEIPDAF